MQVAEASFNDIISPHGTQFVVPVWQRLYSWEEKEWNDLWDDLMILYEKTTKGETTQHFLGSIVIKTVEEKVGEITRRILIDGQQRLTTLLLICALLRDRANDIDKKLASEIEDSVLFNKWAKKAQDRPKLQPTRADQKLFSAIISGSSEKMAAAESQIYAAQKFFKDKLENTKDDYELEKLLDAIRKLKIVTINLDEKDNPNRIFETLNFRGRELAQSDLVRNYFMMTFTNVAEAENIYESIWFPMQQRLGLNTKERIKNLEKFLRHYAVMNKHGFVRENQIYSEMRERVKNASETKLTSELNMINKYSYYYQRLLYPSKESNIKIREGIERLNKLGIGVHYPFLLKVYDEFESNNTQITESDLVDILKTIESYIVRRFFHRMPTHSLNRFFADICNLPEKILKILFKRNLLG